MLAYDAKINTETFPFTKIYHPVIALIIYLTITIYFQPSAKESAANALIKSRGITKLKIVIFFHNLILLVFSAVCWYKTASIIIPLFINNSRHDILCNEKMSDLFKGGFDSTYGFLCYMFYLSKIYEFMDTFIVIARGRRPIFLQTFHHCGAVSVMWLCVVVSASGTYLWLMLNSFVHTIMYFYYAMSSINIRIPGKFIITQLQISQFIIAITIGACDAYFYADCLRFEDKAIYWISDAYTAVVLGLFLVFYSRTYMQKKKKKKN